MSPEQLKALGVKPRAWLVSKEHSGKVFFYIEEVSDWIEDNPDWAVTEELYPHSDLMKVCAAYEARVAELEGALDRAANFIISQTFHDEKFDEIHSSNCAAFRQSSPLTALEEYRKRVRVETLNEAADVAEEGVVEGHHGNDVMTRQNLASEFRRMAEEAGK